MASKVAMTGTLTVTGEGRTEAKPEIARIQLSVVTEAKTAEEAVRENAAAAARAIERLKGLGIRASSIQTAGINVSPKVSYEEGPEKGKITGYRAEDSLNVEVSIDLAGRVIDEAVAAGV